MKIMGILSLLGLLALSPCHAQTTTTPTGNGQALARKLRNMTPGERRQFLKDHPAIREHLRKLRARLLHKLFSMTPAQRKEFLQNHPRLQKYINRHPKLAQKLAGAA